MNIDRFYLYAKEIEAQLPQFDKPDLPLEAELQVALVRNKLTQILPLLSRLVELAPQLEHHYKRIFEVMFQEGYYENHDKDANEG